MSQFSGKCDLCDHFAIVCDDDNEKLQREIERTDFYICTSDGKRHKLKIENEKDLALYYPYLICIGAFNREGDRQYILLSSKSFVDSEEQDRLNWALRDALRAYHRCKRKKIKFDPDEYIKDLYWPVSDYYKDIAYRVAEYGDKANTKGLHSPLHEYYRKQLAKELERLGYPEWFIFEWLFDDRDKNFTWREEE